MVPSPIYSLPPDFVATRFDAPLRVLSPVTSIPSMASGSSAGSTFKNHSICSHPSACAMGISSSASRDRASYVMSFAAGRLNSVLTAVSRHCPYCSGVTSTFFIFVKTYKKTTAISASVRASETAVDVVCGVVVVRCRRLLGVSAAAADMHASRGSTDSTPVKMCGAALEKSNFLTRLRIAGMTQWGISVAFSSGFLTLRGVFRPLSGVFGVVRADASAEVVFLLGVCGSRVPSEAGNALLR